MRTSSRWSPAATGWRGCRYDERIRASRTIASVLAVCLLGTSTGCSLFFMGPPPKEPKAQAPVSCPSAALPVLDGILASASLLHVANTVWVADKTDAPSHTASIGVGVLVLGLSAVSMAVGAGRVGECHERQRRAAAVRAAAEREEEEEEAATEAPPSPAVP